MPCRNPPPALTPPHLCAPSPLPQIVGDDGEEVVAFDVIKQSGGISNGANGPRTTFSAGVQFSISDPAFGKVSAYSTILAACCISLLYLGAGLQFSISDPVWQGARVFGAAQVDACRVGGGLHAYPADPCQLSLPFSVPPQVTAFDGQSDPMLITSDTPGANDGASGGGSGNGTASNGGNSTSGNSTSSSGQQQGECKDVPAPGSYSCQQQKGERRRGREGSGGVGRGANGLQPIGGRVALLYGKSLRHSRGCLPLSDSIAAYLPLPAALPPPPAADWGKCYEGWFEPYCQKTW